MTRLVPVLLALLSFTGCTLIDRRTFAPSPEAKAQPAPAQAPVVLDTRTPLVTIDYTVPSPDYGELLHDAVRAAESRDADVQYDVVSVMKDTADASTRARTRDGRDARHHAGPGAGLADPSGAADGPDAGG